MTSSETPGRSRVRALRSRVARALPVLRALTFVAALAIVVVMAVQAAREVDASQLAWWPLPIAFAGAAAWWLLQARGWGLLVTGRPSRSDVSTWCRTQALRYLPGGIWAPASRATIIRGTLLDRLTTVAADNVIALSAALALGGLALAAAGDLRWLPLVLVLAVPLVASRLVAGRTRVVPARTLRAGWNYVVAFLAYAAAAVLVQAAVSGFLDPLAVAGTASLACSAGLAVVIVPSGMGVRELVYVALLSDSFPTAELAAGAVTMRVVMILAELAILVVAGRPTSGAREQGASGLSGPVG